MNSVYILESDPRSRPAHLRWLSHEFRDAVRIGRGECDPEHRLELTAAGAGAMRSVLWSDCGVFIDESVRRLLVDADVSGWRTVRATILVGSNESADYSLLVTVGRCGRIAYDKSNDDSIIRVPVRGQVHLYRRITVNLDGWDGSDIFVDTAGTTGVIGLSPKAAEVFRKVKGVKPVEAQNTMMFESVE